MAKAPKGKAAAQPLEPIKEGDGAPREAGETTTPAEGNETTVTDVEPGQGKPASAADIEAVAADAAAKVDSPAVAASTPAAPGDDAEAVFGRRMARLMSIVEEAEFESGTALGDLVELIVELFKARPKLWSAMSQDEQRQTARHIEAIGKAVLGKVVLAVAQEDFTTVEGTFLGQFTVKGETIEAKLKLEHADEDLVMSAYRMAGHRVVLISADDKRFQSKRREVEVEPDQRELTFAGGTKEAPREIVTPPPPAHPSDDSDLAGADDDDAKDEGQDADEEAPEGDGLFGVFDDSDGHWLIDEKGGDDGWTTAIGDAGRWPHAEASKLAREHETEEGALKVRLLDEAMAEPVEDEQAEG